MPTARKDIYYVLSLFAHLFLILTLTEIYLLIDGLISIALDGMIPLYHASTEVALYILVFYPSKQFEFCDFIGAHSII